MGWMMKSAIFGLFVCTLVGWQLLVEGCAPSEPTMRHDLENFSYEEVLGKIDKPRSETEFALDDNPLEFRRGLLNKIPVEMRMLQKVRESYWTVGDDVLVVWFVKRDSSWVSIEAMQWNPKRIQF
jgi:hypothetical protein